MSARRKSQVPPDTFWIAEKSYRPLFRDSGGHEYTKASQAFYDLAGLLFSPLDTDDFSAQARRRINAILPGLASHYPRGIFATLHAGNPKYQQALNSLFLELQKALEAAHQSGVEQGNALLIQLARGKLTAKQFNECAMEDQNE